MPGVAILFGEMGIDGDEGEAGEKGDQGYQGTYCLVIKKLDNF